MPKSPQASYFKVTLEPSTLPVIPWSCLDPQSLGLQLLQVIVVPGFLIATQLAYSRVQGLELPVEQQLQQRLKPLMEKGLPEVHQLYFQPFFFEWRPLSVPVAFQLVEFAPRASQRELPGRQQW